ncbi:DNA adenine methylase [Piscinibacterium candidicorallinum]|uniref:DNA adenine methylase n=1 Tax=Piscinibacterium candidicorallinum TaxID=1793872 RepID=A0ABV7H219_9BURK
MPTTVTPLRYPGGKSQLTPFVAELLRANGLSGGVYAEPYAGGAGLAWALLLSGQASEIWINDIDQGIFSFWHSVLNNTEQLCSRIEKTRITMQTWHTQREVMLSNTGSRLDIGFATLFLNRTNRSGIISGGVIGGKNQDGNYKLDCRFNRDELIAKIRRIGSYREVVKLTQIDARACIAKWGKELPKKGLMNIDPPYFAKGRDLYTNFYRPDDHKLVANVISKLKCPWILTYDDTPEICALYSKFRIYRKALAYSAQVKRQANELLVISPKINLSCESSEELAQAA